MYTNLLGCRLCSCSNFNYKTPNTKYKCVCKHGDVWHRHKYSCFNSKMAFNYKLKTRCKKLLRTVFSNYNVDEVCKRCNIRINKGVVLNCKHLFCKRCASRIIVVCPICIKYVTDKAKIVAI